MCYNCGCGMPNNDMGKPENITDQRLAEAAEAMGQSLQQSRKNALDLLEKVIASGEESQEKMWRPGRTPREAK